MRMLVVASAGVAALGIGMWVTRPDGGAGTDEVVAAARVPARAQRAPATAIGAMGPQLPADGERFSEHVTYNPFAALNLNVAAPAPAASAVKAAPKKIEPPPPAPPPVAPPLPFTAVGSIAGPQVTDGQPVAFVKQQDQLLVIHAGDAIGAAYRVESITPKRVEFVYLPLMQRQSLALEP